MGRPELAGLAAPQCLSHTAREACSNYRFLRLKLPRDPRHLRGIHWLRGQIEEKVRQVKGMGLQDTQVCLGNQDIRFC